MNFLSKFLSLLSRYYINLHVNVVGFFKNNSLHEHSSPPKKNHVLFMNMYMYLIDTDELYLHKYY